MAKFQKGRSGNPGGRSKCRTNPILVSIKQVFGGEPEFWNHIAKSAQAGDQNCLNLWAARVRPTFKARSVCVELGMKRETDDADSLYRAKPQHLLQRKIEL